MTKHEYQLISYIVDNSLILPDDAEKIKKDILNLCTVEGMEEISLEERYKSLLNEYNAYKLDGNLIRRYLNAFWIYQMNC